MRTVLKISLCALAAAMPANLHASPPTSQRQADCGGNLGAELQIRSCTEIIASDTETAPSKATALMYRGLGLVQIKDFDRGLADLEQAAAMDSRHVPVMRLSRAGIRFDRKDFDGAIDDLNTVIALRSDVADPFFLRARAYRQKNQLELAAADFDKAIQLDPKKASIYYYRGLMRGDQGLVDRALADFDQAIKLSPKSPEPYLERGNISFNRKAFDRAIADYDEAIRWSSKFPMAYNNRGYAYKNKGQVDRALADYNTALQQFPDYVDALINRGILFKEKGEFEPAIADFDHAIRQSPRTWNAYFHRGHSFQLKGDLDRAIADFNESARLNPKDMGTFNNRGVAYRDKGNLDLAIADFGQAIALDPKYALAYSNRQYAYQAKKDYARAMADIDRAIQLEPNNNEYRNSSCWLRTIAGVQLERARKDCDEAIRLKSDPSYFDTRALLSLKQGRFRESWNDYDVAVRGNPKYAHYRYGRGLAALRLGRKADGDADIAQAVQLDAKIADKFAGYGMTP